MRRPNVKLRLSPSITASLFMQLNQAGALSQGLGLFLGGTGTVDPGTAAFFVLGPAGIAKAFSSPRITELLIKGIGGKGLTIDSTQKLTRYFGQTRTC